MMIHLSLLYVSLPEWEVRLIWMGMIVLSIQEETPLIPLPSLKSVTQVMIRR